MVKGHKMDLRRTESGNRWALSCECGWNTPRWAGDRPRTFATENVALAVAGKHYLRQATEQGVRDRINGVSTSPSQPPTKTEGVAWEGGRTDRWREPSGPA